jgi:hypothetical protein
MLLMRKMEHFVNFEVMKIEGFQKGAGNFKNGGKMKESKFLGYVWKIRKISPLIFHKTIH